MDLGIDDGGLASCVTCGLCLPHCPTYRATGEESKSPRGRIALMQRVQWEGADPTPAFLESMDTCVQCRACEAVCPSAVPFGAMMEATREAVVTTGIRPRRWLRAGLWPLGHPRLLRAGSVALGLGTRLGVVPAGRLGLPSRIPLRQDPLRGDDPVTADVWLFTGCVMDAWQRDVHADAVRVLRAAGFAVAVTSATDAACCGALHHHAGFATDAHRLAQRVMSALPGDRPVLVDSAGCGAMLQDYGRVLNTGTARDFSARVLDVHVWLARYADRLPLRRRDVRIAVQDPCHLRHVQKAHRPVHELLARVGEAIELPDDGLCCGAGGAYSVLHPDLARRIRDRKTALLDELGADVVASANPGCALHLAAAGLEVRHPVQLLAEALYPGPDAGVV